MKQNDYPPGDRHISNLWLLGSAAMTVSCTWLDIDEYEIPGAAPFDFLVPAAGASPGVRPAVIQPPPATASKLAVTIPTGRLYYSILRATTNPDFQASPLRYRYVEGPVTAIVGGAG